MSTYVTVVSVDPDNNEYVCRTQKEVQALVKGLVGRDRSMTIRIRRMVLLISDT